MSHDLPLEVWEAVLEYCHDKELQTSRDVNKAWRRHIDGRIIPAMLQYGHYTVPSVSILLFNGFHQYRSEQKLAFTHVEHDVYHLYKNTVADYAVFAILDPLRYFKLNRLEDVDDVVIQRRCPEIGTGMDLFEAITITKQVLRKHALIGKDEQSILIPTTFLLRDDWDVVVPVVSTATTQYLGAVAMSLYGMGVPDQTWSSSFSSGQNVPY